MLRWYHEPFSPFQSFWLESNPPNMICRSKGVQKIPFPPEVHNLRFLSSLPFFSISKRGTLVSGALRMTSTAENHWHIPSASLLFRRLGLQDRSRFTNFSNIVFFGPFWSDTFFSSKMSEAPVFFCCKLSEHLKVVPKETHLLLSKPKGGTAVCAQNEFHEISAIQSKKIATYAAVVMVIMLCRPKYI